jgi:hypothetical protein
VTCKTCGKTTWAGCGQHVAQVKAGVPAGQWCTCERDAPAPVSVGGLLARLFGKH